MKTKSNLIPIKSDNNTNCKNVLLGKVAHFLCALIAPLSQERAPYILLTNVN